MSTATSGAHRCFCSSAISLVRILMSEEIPLCTSCFPANACRRLVRVTIPTRFRLRKAGARLIFCLSMMATTSPRGVSSSTVTGYGGGGPCRPAPRGCLLAVLVEPALHESDFALLRLDDLLGGLPDLRILAEREHGLCHIDRTRVMREHSFHEVHVGISREGDIHGVVHLHIDAAERLARRPGVPLRLRRHVV